MDLQLFCLSGAEMARLRAIIDAWLEESSSQNTRTNYARILAEWIEHRQAGRLMKERAILHVPEPDAKAYILMLSNRPGITTGWGQGKAASSTVTTYRNAIRSFYAYLIKRGEIPLPNPFDFKLKIQERRKREYQAVSDDDVLSMLMRPDLTTFDGRRDHAILCLLFGSGMRRAEVASLAIGDILEQGETTKYRLREQKNGKLSALPMPVWAAKAVLAVKADRIKDGSADNSPLFIKRRGCKAKMSPGITSRLVAKIFDKYAQLAGIRGQISPHCARATAITKLLEMGLTYREVQEFSRHSSIKMVELYDKRRFKEESHPSLKIEYCTSKKVS